MSAARFTLLALLLLPLASALPAPLGIDLEARGMFLLFPPPAPRAGDAIEIGALVRATHPVPVLVDVKVDGASLGRILVAAPGSPAQTGTTVTWTATAGVHQLALVVDAEGAYAESNEANNRYERQLVVG